MHKQFMDAQLSLLSLGDYTHFQHLQELAVC